MTEWTEIRTLRRLPPHPHIIKLLDVIDLGDMRYVVHEYIEEGDLFEYVLTHQLTERLCKQFFAQIVKAVHFLHKHGVIHHDIKLENVGLRKGGSLVLMDFGYCCEFSNDVLLSRFCGTLSYCAPELVISFLLFFSLCFILTIMILLFDTSCLANLIQQHLLMCGR